MVKTYPLQLLFAKTVSQCHAERHIGRYPTTRGPNKRMIPKSIICKYKRVEHRVTSLEQLSLAEFSSE